MVNNSSSTPTAAITMPTSGEAAIGNTFTPSTYTPGMSPLNSAATGAQMNPSDSDSNVTAMVK